MSHEHDTSWGDSYLDHYERYFRSPCGHEVFAPGDDGPKIQILEYDHVFPEAMVFASLGLTIYERVVRHRAEVYLVADDGLESVAQILANALFYTVRQKMEIGWGMAVGGIAAVDARFAMSFGKSAIYFTNPFGLPAEFRHVKNPQRPCEEGGMLLGLFISPTEYEFFQRSGAVEFERLLEKNEVDPYDIRRPAVV